ncbi:ATP-binding cassette domain-containing protein [Actinomadura sp. LD22]|uniref:ATP-binding cassette domain-containing protein n=1 Tax=Actinomadura physcomitrii TaxID=2650748 RepID=A0A6I4MIV1_9ACTN|nr:oligopeptide/dipeptide ABC transporter ATP-binding protein [Actinomadura physcomitrii]MWA04820.1 ATP-binding cassette domain-containing protein [Actinomadura physcomitrii]
MAGTGKAHLRRSDSVVLSVEDLVVEYRLKGSGDRVHAVSGISLDVLAGETLGLVGESGCGKSTTARAVLGLPRPTSGSVRFDDVEVTTLSEREMRRFRPKAQMVFQDPIASLNPRRTVEDVVAEPSRIVASGTRAERREKVRTVLREVGLDPDVMGSRRARQLSGGQCQRLSIARALVLDPDVLICDEPVSALDVSVQAQVLNLLGDLSQKRRLSMLFISHDLAVVKNVSDRVIVMYLGKICETARPDPLYARPAHPYTAGLLGAIPVPDPGIDPRGRRTVQGEPPSPINPPSGCRFRTRCPFAQKICADEEPEIREIDDNHYVACHFPLTHAAAA